MQFLKYFKTYLLISISKSYITTQKQQRWFSSTYQKIKISQYEVCKPEVLELNLILPYKEKYGKNAYQIKPLYIISKITNSNWLFQKQLQLSKFQFKIEIIWYILNDDFAFEQFLIKSLLTDFCHTVSLWHDAFW